MKNTNAEKVEKNTSTNHQPEKASKPQTAPAPSVVATARTSEPTPTQKEKKVKTPSISAATRKLVILNQDKTVDEIAAMLIAGGWDAKDVEKRKSTIATLRTDALAIIGIAKEEGCWKQ